jgi:hypothetical protein
MKKRDILIILLAFKAVHQGLLQLGRCVIKLFMENYYLLELDGTGILNVGTIY